MVSERKNCKKFEALPSFELGTQDPESRLLTVRPLTQHVRVTFLEYYIDICFIDNLATPAV